MLFFMSYLFLTDNKGNIIKRLGSFFCQKWIVAFLGYAAFLFTTTVIARYRSKPIYSGIGTFGIVRNGKLNMEITINVLFFIPYTYLYNLAFKPNNRVLASFLLSLLSTVFIELFQVFFWVGQGTVADVIHNVIGGMIGCGLWYLISFF